MDGPDARATSRARARGGEGGKTPLALLPSLRARRQARARVAATLRPLPRAIAPCVAARVAAALPNKGGVHGGHGARLRLHRLDPPFLFTPTAQLAFKGLYSQ